MVQNSLKISVIIPSFNQGQFIEETIISLVTQDYIPIEIIIVDGGSTDNTTDIIKKYEAYITYWISEKDTGQSEAINKGFDRATGDVITWLNSDDCYEPGTLQKVAAAFISDSELSILHGRSVLFGKSIKQKIVGLDHVIPLYEYFPYMRFPQPSSFFREKALKKALPVNNTLHYAMDFELVVKMLLTNSKIKRTDEILSRYRLHASSKSNNHLAFLKEWTWVVGNFFNSVKEGQKYTALLNKLGMLEAQGDVIYSNTLNFKSGDLEIVFLKHLNICYHYHYKEFNKKECIIISEFLSSYSNAFYRSNNYKKYNNRLKFIPKFVFHFIRALSD